MTPFGEYCRTIRNQYRISLKEQATALAVSSSFLSSLEHGGRNKPTKNLISKISNFYSLSPIEVYELEQAAEDSSTIIKIPLNSETQIYRVMNRMSGNPIVFSKSELDIIEVIVNHKNPFKEKIMNTT